MAETYRFALVGNPNVGKSSLFNALTGLHQHTGNWPGKTVATAAGRCSTDGAAVELIDLPGTYSLSARSPEEEVAAEYISFGCADAVIVVCDATALERNLYLALQVMEITDHVVICVNLMDEAGKRGITVDLPRLSQLLGVRVVGTSARQKKTLPPLLRAAVAAAQERHRKPVPVRYGEAIEAGLFSIGVRLDELLPGSIPNHRWIAMQLLTGGDTAIRALEKKLGRPLEEDPFLSEAVRLGRERIDRAGETAAAAAAVLLRRAADIAAEVVSVAHQNGFSRDRRADRILTGKKFGIPIMLLLLLILFYLTVQGANYPSAFLSSMLFAFGDILSRWLLAAGIPLWLHDALILGVYRVTAWVVSVMLPPMAIFFPLFTLLEDLGYLPRVAFNLDNRFRRCAACGKQALTMCMGLGCNAAGVIGCRIIDSPRERLIAILTNAFVPCNGRFPMLTAVIAMFFAGAAGSLGAALLLAAAIVLSVAATFATSRLLSRTLLRGVPSSFTLELPPYRRPQVGRVLVRSVFDRTLFVLARAASVAAPAGLLIYALANIAPGGVTLLARLSGALDPLGRLLGLDGVILMAFLLGLPANEIVIPIIFMAYSASGALTEYGTLAQLRALLTANGWTWLTALNMLLFSLFHWPCSTTLLAIRRETQSWKWTGVAALLPTLAGAGLCLLTATAARLLGAA